MTSFLCMNLAFVVTLVSVSVFAQGTTDCRTLHCYQNNGSGLIVNDSEVACPSGYTFPQACFDMYPDVTVPVCDEPAGASFSACLLRYPAAGFVFSKICEASASSSSTISATGTSCPTPVTTAPPAQTSTPAQCVSSLTCTYADFNMMTMDDRLLFMQTLESQRGPTFNATMQFRNMEAIIAFFRDNNLGAPGTWVSYTDASILEGVERGFAIALGLPTVTCENPCAPVWAAFLEDLKSGKPFSLFIRCAPLPSSRLADRPTHDYRWGVAEQNCTDYGADTLAPLYNAEPTEDERIWFKFSQLYRWVLRNEGPALNILNAIPDADEFILWFTDVSNFTATRKLTQIAWDVSKGVASFIDATANASLLLWYSPLLVTEWKKETGGV